MGGRLSLLRLGAPRPRVRRLSVALRVGRTMFPTARPTVVTAPPPTLPPNGQELDHGKRIGAPHPREEGGDRAGERQRGSGGPEGPRDDPVARRGRDARSR